MSAETLGASFTIDITDLKNGILTANKIIRESESEFKSAASGMDDWTNSADGVTARIKHLNTSIDVQKKKISSLTQDYKKQINEGLDPSSKAAMDLRIKINKEQEALNKNEKELKAQTKALEELANAQDDTAKSTDKACKGLSALKGIAGVVVGSIVGLGAAAVAGFLSLSDSTRELRANMAKLETGFTTAGHSAESATDTYKTLYGVLGDEGKATEAAAHLSLLAKDQKDLAKWTNIAAGVYAQFGDSLPIENLTEASNETAKTGKITGGLADALNWVGISEEEFQAKLDKTTSEQERQQLITETLNKAYSEQADTFKELNKDVIAAREAEADLALVQAELGKSAEPLNTALTNIKTNMLTSVTPAVKELSGAFTDLLNGKEGAGQNLLNVVSNIFSQLGTKANEFKINLLNWINDLIPTLLPKLAEFLSSIIQKSIEYAPQLLNAFISLLGSVVSAIPPTVDKLLTELPKILQTILSTFSNAFPILLETAGQLFNKVVEAIPIVLQSLQSALPSIISTVVNFITSNLPLMLSTAVDFLMQIVRAIPSVVSGLMSNLPKIITTTISALVNAVPKILSAAFTMFGGILSAIPKIAGELLRSMPDIISSIVKGLLGGVKDLVKVGGDLLGGLLNGMLNPKAILEAVKKLGNNIVEGIEDFFDINSPSKVMEGLGEFNGQGLAIGTGKGYEDKIKDVNKSIVKSMNGMSNNTSGTNNNSNSGLASGQTTQQSSIVVNQYNTYSQSHSRYELYKSKQDTETAVKLAIAGGVVL